MNEQVEHTDNDEEKTNWDYIALMVLFTLACMCVCVAYPGIVPKVFI